MKSAPLILLVLFALTGTSPAYAEEQAINEKPVESIDAGGVASVTTPEASQPVHGQAHGGRRQSRYEFSGQLVHDYLPVSNILKLGSRIYLAQAIRPRKRF